MFCDYKHLDAFMFYYMLITWLLLPIILKKKKKKKKKKNYVATFVYQNITSYSYLVFYRTIEVGIL